MEWIVKVIFLISTFLLATKILLKKDKQLAVNAKRKPVLVITVIILFFISFILSSFWEVLFWFSLSLAAYSDYLTQEIYDIVYAPGVGICIAMLGITGSFKECEIIELIVFIVLQTVVFRKLYGISDCIAFSMCAMYLYLHGKVLVDYIILMLGIFLVLTIIQFFKKNIDKGKFKEPVALIPYIAFAITCVQYINFI